MSAEPIRILMRVAQIMEELDIPYLICGSFASSIFGIPRATQDVDLVVDLQASSLEDFIKAMQVEFYIDRDAVAQALQRRSSFNAIHFETVQKIDFFVCRHSGHAVEEMRRRFPVVVDPVAGRTIFVATAEDVILQKLSWYRLGSQASERQWIDVVGVIKVPGARLVRDYLARWA